MLWYDTTNNTLKMRSEANDQWISIGYLDQSADAFRIFDDTQVVNASGTQTGLIGDQATATWEAGTATTESLVSPAKVKAAVEALAPVDTSSVLAATAGASYGAVGTYIFARASADVLAGDTVAGSDLLATSAARSVPYSTSASFASSGGLSGTWRAMGRFDYSVNASVAGETQTVLYGATLWLRIS